MDKIKVLIVDDSALVRRLVTEILQSDPSVDVIGTASDPYVAREKIKKLNPDVITLDVEMPRMDGITFLENLMRLRPMPVLMVSSLTQRGAEVTLRALELGAVDFIAKPKIDVAGGLGDYTEEIIAKVKAAARARESERRARAAARKRTMTGWLPRRHVMPGTLAARRRREVAATIAVLVALNLLVWIVRPDWQARLAALVVSILLAPILHLFIRRS